MSLDLDVFDKARRETAIWCETEGKLLGFRTPSLRPVVDEWPSFLQLNDAVETLRRLRRGLLPVQPAGDSPPGRLLTCNISESLIYGVTESVTSGFFDSNDRPPWDTWIWHFATSSPEEAGILVSWVPQALERLVTRAIDQNPDYCLCWLSDPLLGSDDETDLKRLALLERQARDV